MNDIYADREAYILADIIDAVSALLAGDPETAREKLTRARNKLTEE